MSHILFISHARGIHGAEAVMVQAIKACAAKGARVTVVVPSIVPDEGMEKALQGIRNVQELPLPYRAGGVDLLRTRLVRLYNLWTLRQLERYVEQERVTTIYSNTTITILGAELAKRTHVRHIWHWHEPVDERFGWHFTLKEYFCSLIEVTDQIICISQHQKEEWSKELDRALENAQMTERVMQDWAVMVTTEKASVSRFTADLVFMFRQDQLRMITYEFQRPDAEADFQYMAGALSSLYGEKQEADPSVVKTLMDAINPGRYRLEQMSQTYAWIRSDGTAVFLYFHGPGLFSVMYAAPDLGGGLYQTQGL